MPTMTVPSAAMRRLRREGIEISRRRMTLAPTAVIAKNKNASVLALPAPLPRSNPAPTPTRPRPLAPCHAAGGDAARLERTPPPPHSAAISRSRHAHAAAPSDAPEVAKSKRIGKGAQVRVRTRVGTACTGQPIVLWLRAVVDAAAAEDGYVHVTYSYASAKLPRVARVAPTDIRMHDDDVQHTADARGTADAPIGSSKKVTGDGRSVRPPQQSKVAPRPTVAGKKLPLLKKYVEEMKAGPRQS